MQENQKFKERREFTRVKLTMPVEYKKLREAPEMKKGSLVKDLSLGGVRFVTDEFLAFTARLILDISLPLPERPVSALSKVAWIKKLPAGERYEVGSQFLEMPKEDKNRLANYLDRVTVSAT